MLVAVLALVLRLAFLERNPLWCDELATLQRLQLPLRQHLLAMQGNHPLYEMLLRFWMPPDGSDGHMRLPSAILGVIAVLLMLRFVRPLGHRAAQAAALLLLFAPLHVLYSRIARPYALSCTLAILSNLCLLWGMRRRRALPLVLYALVTALMLYANLLAGGVWAAQGLYLLWTYRRRLRRLAPWIISDAAVGLMILPWMLFSFRGAVAWGQETVYTAQQLGRLAKTLYVAMALCLGETVHPLTLWVVLPAVVAFGGATLLGVVTVLRRRRGIGVLLFLQVTLGFVIGLYFGAASPKHLIVLLPALFGLIALGMTRLRRPGARWIVLGTLLLTMTASLFNLFAQRQYHDADMVTPWREMVSTVDKTDPSRTETILVGYRPDPSARDMFSRYNTRMRPDRHRAVERLDFSDYRGQVLRELSAHPAVWLLLHDLDPCDEIETRIRTQRLRVESTTFQDEEHTLEALRAWRAGRPTYNGLIPWLRSLPEYRREHRSPLYRLYRVTTNTDSGVRQGL